MNDRLEYKESIKNITENFVKKASNQNKRSATKKVDQIRMIMEKVSEIYLQEINESEVISKKNKTRAQLKQKYSTY